MISEQQVRVVPAVAAQEQQLIGFLAEEYGYRPKDVTAIRILKRSIDARQRQIYVNLTVRVYLNEQPKDEAYQPTDYPDVSDAPQVIVVLPPHTFFEMAGVNYDDYLEELIAKEKTVAENLGLPVIDARSFNEGQADMFVDGIHFTVDGYALLAETIYTQLCAILQG